MFGRNPNGQGLVLTINSDRLGRKEDTDLQILNHEKKIFNYLDLSRKFHI